MGLGGISIWQLLIILVIVLLLFGTKKLKGMGSDLGGAVKGFKDSMSDEDKAEQADTQEKVAEEGQSSTTAEDTQKQESKQ